MAGAGKPTKDGQGYMNYKSKRPTNPFFPRSVALSPVSSGFRILRVEVGHEQIGAVVAWAD